MSPNVLNNNPAQAYEASMGWRMRLVAAGAAVSVLAVAGCSSASEAPSSVAQSTVTDKLASDLKTACGDINLAEKSADTKFGSPDSLFPSLTNPGVNGGPSTFRSIEDIKKDVKYQITHDPYAAATIYAAVVEPREDGHSANEFTKQSVVDAYNIINTNPVAQASVAIKDCNATAFLTSDDKFSLITGAAQGVLTTRGDNNKITNIRAEDIKGATVKVAEFGFNQDSNLSVDQIAASKKLQTLVGIDETGRVLVNKIVGTGSFDINPKGAPVEVKVGATQTIEATQDTSNAKQGANNAGSTGESNPGGNPTGGITSGPKSERNPNGPNAAPNPGAVQEATPGTDNTPNGGAGVITKPAPGVIGGVTPSTHNQPPTTTYNQPPTTTDTQTQPPRTTTPPTTIYTTTETTPATATTIPKGTQPSCVPNPPYTIC